MLIKAISAFQDNYIWLIIDYTAATTIVVDPGVATPVIDYLTQANLTPSALFLTHHHADHIGGAAELIRQYPHVSCYGPQDIRIPFKLITEGPIHLSQGTFSILSIPGHTASHIAFYEPRQQVLFCGDTLFSAGCGRVFDGTYESLFESLKLLQSLPEETQIYCGHEYTYSNLQFALNVEPENRDIQHYYNYLNQHPGICTLPSNLKKEKKINPFLRLQQPTVQMYAQQKGCTQPHNLLSVFTTLRKNKSDFTTKKNYL